VLLYLLQHYVKKQALCFTSSIETNHRLYTLLRLMGTDCVEEYSASLPQVERDALLRRFQAGQVKMLICSDVMARGLDISDVSAVVNYDPPHFLRNYVHRVGRTARAGREGSSYTLLRPDDMRHFKEMMKKAEAPAKAVKKIVIQGPSLAPYMKSYKENLEKLKDELAMEKSKKRARQ